MYIVHCSNNIKLTCTLYKLHTHVKLYKLSFFSPVQYYINKTQKTQLTAGILPSCETQPGFSILMVTRIKQEFITTLRQSFQLCPSPYWIVSWLILLGASLAHTCTQITSCGDSCGYTTAGPGMTSLSKDRSLCSYENSGSLFYSQRREGQEGKEGSC